MVVPFDANHCPPNPEETAEAYCMGTLVDQDNLVAFEEHYLACPRCSAIVEETERYVRAMQSDGRRFRARKPGKKHGVHA